MNDEIIELSGPIDEPYAGRTGPEQAGEISFCGNENLANIFEAMADGVSVVSQQYDIQYVNSVLEREFGPCKGRKCYEYFGGRSEVCPWCEIEEIFDKKYSMKGMDFTQK